MDLYRQFECHSRGIIPEGMAVCLKIEGPAVSSITLKTLLDFIRASVRDRCLTNQQIEQLVQLMYAFVGKADDVRETAASFLIDILGMPGMNDKISAKASMILDRLKKAESAESKPVQGP